MFGADGRARFRVAEARRGTRNRSRDRYPPLQVPGGRVELRDRHVEREHEHVVVAERDAAVRDDAEVAEDGNVVRRPTPLDLSALRIDRPDVVVVRRHVERSVRLDRIRLLAPPHTRVDLLEVDRVGTPETIHVARIDLGQRRVPELVRRVSEPAPADVCERVGARRCTPDEKSQRKRCDDQCDHAHDTTIADAASRVVTAGRLSGCRPATMRRMCGCS